MEETIKIQLDIPKDFNRELEIYLLDHYEKGKRKSKACLLIELAILGMMQITEDK